MNFWAWPKIIPRMGQVRANRNEWMHFAILRPHLGGENGMKWKGMKIIILEYSSLLLFRSFNGENEKSIH